MQHSKLWSSLSLPCFSVCFLCCSSHEQNETFFSARVRTLRPNPVPSESSTPTTPGRTLLSSCVRHQALLFLLAPVPLLLAASETSSSLLYAQPRTPAACLYHQHALPSPRNLSVASAGSRRSHRFKQRTSASCCSPIRRRTPPGTGFNSSPSVLPLPQHGPAPPAHPPTAESSPSSDAMLDSPDYRLRFPALQ